MQDGDGLGDGLLADGEDDALLEVEALDDGLVDGHSGSPAMVSVMVVLVGL